MKHFTVIGDPVEHSLSPIMHSWIFQKIGIDAEYTKTYTTLDDLPTVIELMKSGKLDGMNVTIPHKEAVIVFLNEINLRAESIGSVNCIMTTGGKTIGNNTDWYGFSKMLVQNEINVTGKEVIILGAGGAAKAVIFALGQLGVKKIRLLNRTLSRAQKLESDIISAHLIEQADKIIKDNSILINCTSIGMDDNSSPVHKSLISGNQILVDIIYIPHETRFLEIGKLKGAKTVNGLDMFIYQGIASLELWLGESLNDKVNFDQLKKYLEEQL